MRNEGGFGGNIENLLAKIIISLFGFISDCLFLI